MAAHDVDHVDPGQQILDESLGDHGASARRR
jgi:hypothetical protein